MAATLTIKRSQLSYESGIPMRMVREIIIDLGLETDPSTIDDFMQAVIDDAELPPIGEQVTITSIEGQAYDMFMLDRQIEQIGLQQARVIDTFEAITVGNPGDGDNLSPIRISGAVSATETEVDKSGSTITVSHGGESQGGTIRANEAAMQLAFDMAVETYTPTDVIVAWQNKINSADWFGGSPGVWLCTRVNVQPIQESSTPPRWKFTFEFQAKPYPGWQPWVRYIDPETGKPPVGLVDGTGYKQVQHYDEADFNLLRQG